MSDLIAYFNDMPSTHRSILLVAGLAFFWIWESIIPLFRFAYHKWRHAGINIFFTATTALVNLPLAFLLIKASDWVTAEQVGVLGWINMPLWLKVIVGLLVMDFISAWLIHWIEHHVRWMWKFHIIHHADQQVDTTTGNRHHPGESVFRYVFTLLAVLVAGAPIWLIFLYQSLSVVMTQFNHANIRIPRWLDRILVYVVVTPDMHRVHHHYRAPYTDRNYGNMFSIWDRLFGTYVEADNRKLRYGLDTHMEHREAHHIGELLRIPFLPYKKRLEYPDEEHL